MMHISCSAGTKGVYVFGVNNCAVPSVNHHTIKFSFHFPFTHLVISMTCCRYLLRRSALELFMVDRSNFFLDFGVRPL